METADLISRLSQDCSPVTVLPGAKRTATKYFVGTCAFAAFVLWILGAREISSVKLPWYWVGEIAVLVALLGASLHCAFQLRTPGEEVLRPWKPVVALLALWLFYLISGSLYVVNGSGVAGVWPVQGVSCGLTVIALCTLPVASLLLAVNRGFPTARRWAGFAIMVSGCVASVLGIEFHCVYESTTHHIVYHFAPVVIMGALGWLAERVMFRSTRG